MYKQDPKTTLIEQRNKHTKHWKKVLVQNTENCSLGIQGLPSSILTKILHVINVITIRRLFRSYLTPLNRVTYVNYKLNDIIG